jgi:amidase
VNDLCFLSAREAVRRLRRREVSPLDLVEAAAARIEEVEPKVNALPIRLPDAARDQARHFARDVREHDGWLAGLPCGEGLQRCRGSAHYIRLADLCQPSGR